MPEMRKATMLGEHCSHAGLITMLPSISCGAKLAQKSYATGNVVCMKMTAWKSRKQHFGIRRMRFSVAPMHLAATIVDSESKLAQFSLAQHLLDAIGLGDCFFASTNVANWIWPKCFLGIDAQVMRCYGQAKKESPTWTTADATGFGSVARSPRHDASTKCSA